LHVHLLLLFKQQLRPLLSQQPQLMLTLGILPMAMVMAMALDTMDMALAMEVMDIDTVDIMDTMVRDLLSQ